MSFDHSLHSYVDSREQPKSVPQFDKIKLNYIEITLILSFSTDNLLY